MLEFIYQIVLFLATQDSYSYLHIYRYEFTHIHSYLYWFFDTSLRYWKVGIHLKFLPNPLFQSSFIPLLCCFCWLHSAVFTIVILLTTPLSCMEVLTPLSFDCPHGQLSNHGIFLPLIGPSALIHVLKSTVSHGTMALTSRSGIETLCKSSQKVAEAMVHWTASNPAMQLFLSVVWFCLWWMISDGKMWK